MVRCEWNIKTQEKDQWFRYVVHKHQFKAIFDEYRPCVFVKSFIIIHSIQTVCLCSTIHFLHETFHVNFQCPLLHNFYVQITWYRLIVPRTTECPGGMLGDPVCVREYFWGGIVLILVVKTLNTVWGRVS